MEPIVKTYSSFKKHKQELSDAKELLAGAGGDEEMKDLAKLEISGLEDEINKEEEQLKILLIPKDPRDEKNVILEIRADTGGEEAALFGSDLLRMYSMYADSKNWKTEIIELNETGLNGIKEANMVGRTSMETGGGQD